MTEHSEDGEATLVPMHERENQGCAQETDEAFKSISEMPAVIELRATRAERYRQLEEANAHMKKHVEAAGRILEELKR